MTPALPLGHELEAGWRFRIIEKINFHGSMEMSFFAWNMEMSFLWYALYVTVSARPRKSG
jgi:hypothetical protein